MSGGRQADGRLALQEAELRELRHRMRNSMQMIGSLLGLQAAQAASLPVREALDQAAGRVRAVSLAHERASRNRAGRDRVDLRGYLRALLEAAGVIDPKCGITLTFRADGAALALDRAVPLGLVVNELLDNARRHGCRGGAGTLTVELRTCADGSLALLIADDGPGLPENVDIASPRTLGLKLAARLARQADAEIAREPRPGAAFRITLAAEPDHAA